MSRNKVTFKTFGGEWVTIYQDEDPSGYFQMKQQNTAPMFGLDRKDNYDWNHTETYDDGY
jgi:hypothetical protein